MRQALLRLQRCLPAGDAACTSARALPALPRWAHSGPSAAVPTSNPSQHHQQHFQLVPQRRTIGSARARAAAVVYRTAGTMAIDHSSLSNFAEARVTHSDYGAWLTA